MFKPRSRGKRISVYDALAGKSKCLKKSVNSQLVEDLQNNVSKQASEQAKKQRTERYETTTEYDDEIDRQFLYRMLTMKDD